MPTLAQRYEENTTADLAALGPALARAVAVVPLAATEQHGAHLPLGTDAIIADAMVERVLARLPETLAATFLPVQRIGTSDEHGSFPGTLSLDWRTGAETLLRIGEGLARAGFRRMCFVSSHGGNTQVMELAALDLRRRFGLLCATAGWQRFGLPDGLVPELERAIGIHGGAVETALMLAFRPDLVRAQSVADQPSRQSEMALELRHLRAHGRLGFGWLAEDLNPVGTVGDARLASAAMGEAIADHQARGFVEFLSDIARFDLGAGLVQSPRGGTISGGPVME
ncbi:creatininase family protein [Aureimonas sp. AU40]|uniref:creatininase family protein n=1 Tax=Aureimonas sp. AU40 TaxID=1637747 RepID=UPI0007865C14|nr:creatininase family protein [Aureimonas sp. AU40]